MDETNPYAPPAADVALDRMRSQIAAGQGVWREGKFLVMNKSAVLPARCLRCNAPATYWLKQTRAWHNPWLYWLILFPGLLIYLIVAVFVRKTAKVQLPLCDKHRTRRLQSLLIATVIILGGCTMFYFGMVTDHQQLKLLILGGAIVFIFGLMALVSVSQFVPTKKIDITQLWLKGVCPAYLDELSSQLLGDDGMDAKAKSFLAEL